MAFTFTDENVNEIIESGKPVMIDFWATWCGPCVGMSPAVDTVAEEYEGRAVVGKYNIDEQTDLAMKYRIMSIPTILFFKDGKKTELRLVGAQSVETLRAKLDELLAL
ncbi:thioredoxin [Muribaculaceae bacterium]|jgi:thioredoxin 1|uniref:thioredoxin n=1 Tax=uncultured Duncaniella sp. TaxID=2768039 RepID=UPI000AE1B9E2|nr:thioredoxin [uncultured Duncaniella sp.]MCX4259698.1 thioredoxin [Muribaculaceae bacterium]GFI05480.1 thioredoxin [Muribaculaceae bacterium]